MLMIRNSCIQKRYLYIKKRSRLPAYGTQMLAHKITCPNCMLSIPCLSFGMCFWSWLWQCCVLYHVVCGHDDVIKWKHFPRNWPFVRVIHRSPVISPHKGQWRGALMFPLICVWINDWVNNREAGDLRRYRAHSDVIVMGPKLQIMLHSSYICRSTPTTVSEMSVGVWGSLTGMLISFVLGFLWTPSCWFHQDVSCAQTSRKECST